jgi:hypothetical protein
MIDIAGLCLVLIVVIHLNIFVVSIENVFVVRYFI